MGSALPALTGSVGARTPEEYRRAKQIDFGAGDLQATGGAQINKGMRDYKTGTKALREPLDYYKTLLSGSRQDISDLLGTQIKQANQQFDSARQARAEFAPRGGGETAAETRADTAKAGQVGDMFLTAREKGAEGVANIAEILAKLGLGSEAAGGSNIATALQTLLQHQGIELDRTMAAQQSQAQAGQAIGQMIAMLAMGA